MLPLYVKFAGLQLILSDIWDAVDRVVLLSPPLPIIPSPWTLAATDPAANTHTHSVIVLPDGRCQMTWPPELVTLRHNHYEDDGTQTQNAQIHAACPCNMKNGREKLQRPRSSQKHIVWVARKKNKNQAAHDDALEVNSSVFETKKRSKISGENAR